MNLKAEQLNEHLSSQGLSETYIISGDEPVSVQDSADTIRKQAALNGYNERKVFHVDSKFDWNTILFEVDNMSLFSEKKVYRNSYNFWKTRGQGIKNNSRISSKKT